jgi:hypothetical protein
MMTLSAKYVVSLRLEYDVIRALERAAVSEDRTVSALARRIIVEWLSKQPKPTS